jgi:ATP-dependent helicase/nuclease subunit A
MRSHLHDRYRRLLLDEFQDTDPIQLEIAVRLAAHPTTRAVHRLDALRPLPGRLFIVGDPKQSIYRFRRADIAQYLRAADQIGADREPSPPTSARPRRCSTGSTACSAASSRSRSRRPARVPALSTPAARTSTTARSRCSGVDAHDDLGSSRRPTRSAPRGRRRADAVATALVERWQVVDDDTHELRECRPGDITILLPARTSLPALELALRERGMPYRAENSSVVYVTTEIRHLMLALRAAADPTDELALVAALRTPLYGCSDVELYEWRAPEVVVDLVAPTTRPTTSSGTRSPWPSLTPGRSPNGRAGGTRRPPRVAGRRAAPARRRPRQPDARDVWRRVRYVDRPGPGLERRRRPRAAPLPGLGPAPRVESRNADTILPEHDDDAVRIMTVHAAKGSSSRSRCHRHDHPADHVERTRSCGTTALVDDLELEEPDPIFEDFKPIDEQMSDAERRRFLYVACTRAVDHLVVSSTGIRVRPRCARQLGERRAAPPGGRRRSESGATVPRTCGGWFGRARHGARPGVARPRRVGGRASAGVRHAADGSDQPSVAATSPPAPGEADTDPGLDKGAVDLDLPPWQRGRYGTAVGRAVHAVLQYCDLAPATTSLRRGRPVRRGRHHRAGRHRRCPRPFGARCADRPCAPSTCQHHRELFVAAPSAAAPSRGTSICSSRRRRRPHRRLQDRRSGPTGCRAPNGSPGTAASSPSTASWSNSSSATGRGRACSSGAAPTAPPRRS